MEIIRITPIVDNNTAFASKTSISSKEKAKGYISDAISLYYEVQIEVLGDIEGILKFIYSIKANPKIMKINKLNIRSQMWEKRGRLSTQIVISIPIIGEIKK